jgi:RNA polymerase sigma factor (sigma-70 family)
MYEQEGGWNPVLGAPGSNNYGGLLASSTINKGRSDVCKFQGLSNKHANDLCLQHKPLVYKIARRYQGKGIKLDELKAAGLLGLVEASRKFDPERGVPFGGYAQHWIAGAIKNLFRPKNFAPDFQREDSLDAPLPTDGKDNDSDKPLTLGDKLADERPVYTLDLSALSGTDCKIIEARIAGHTLSEIGKAQGLSAERIRQREARAGNQIKGSVASECISELAGRGKVIRFPGRGYTRTEPGFRDRPPPQHAYRQPEPSNEIGHHRRNASRLADLRANASLRNSRGLYGGPVIHDWGWA